MAFDKPMKFFGDQPDQVPFGTYTFKVGRINPEKHYKKLNDGTAIAIVPLKCDLPDCMGYTSATFFFKPQSLKRVADFVEIVTGQRPTLQAIETSNGFKAYLEKCIGNTVRATVSKGKVGANGKAYVNVGDFKADSYDAPANTAAPRSAAPAPAEDTAQDEGVPF